MENATKALLIAAGVLIGVLILSLGTYLYFSLGDYISSTKEEMEINASNQFNVQFTKYINWDGEPTHSTDFVVTIQDVITAANLAYQNNFDNDLIDPNQNYNKSTYYVSVDAWINGRYMSNIEKSINANSAQYLSNTVNQQYRYKCSNKDVIFSEITGRVCKIIFR